MTGLRKLWASWSTGKDSTLALCHLKRLNQFEITGLVTTVNGEFDRVAMHSTREELLNLQSDRLGLPVQTVRLPFPCPNGVYEERMSSLIASARGHGISAMMFGDLFLEDVRAYRHTMLKDTGIEPVFPIWGLDTREAAKRIIQSGIRSIITCVDGSKLSRDFAGREFDAAFLADLPGGIDPCGENGEFHTFVFDAPIFDRPIPVAVKEVVDRDGYFFADVIPVRSI